MGKVDKTLIFTSVIIATLLLCSCNSSSEKDYAEKSEKVLTAATEYYNNKYNTGSVVETDSIRTWDMMTLDTSELWYKATDEDGSEYKIVYDVDEERFYDNRQTNEIQPELQEYYYESMKHSGLEVIYPSVYIDGKKCGTNGNWSVFSTFYDGDMERFLENEPNLRIRAGQITYIADNAELDGSLSEKEEAAAKRGTGTLVESNHGFEEGVEKLCNILTSFGNVYMTEISVISSETAANIDGNNKFILPFRTGCEYFVSFDRTELPDGTVRYYHNEYFQDKVYLQNEIYVGIAEDRYQLKEGDLAIEELAVIDNLIDWKNSSILPKESCFIYKITLGDNLVDYMKASDLSHIQIRFQYPDGKVFYEMDSESEYVAHFSGDRGNVQWGVILDEYGYDIIVIPK